jgi:hypothetical protein
MKNVILIFTVFIIVASSCGEVPQQITQLPKSTEVNRQFVAQFVVDSKNTPINRELVRDLGIYTQNHTLQQGLDKVSFLKETEQVCQKYGYKIEEVKNSINGSPVFKIVMKSGNSLWNNGRKLMNFRKDPKVLITFGIAVAGGIYEYCNSDDVKVDSKSAKVRVDSTFSYPLYEWDKFTTNHVNK